MRGIDMRGIDMRGIDRLRFRSGTWLRIRLGTKLSFLLKLTNPPAD